MRIFFLLLLLLCSSCISAQVEEQPPQILVADLTVMYVNKTDVGLFSRLYGKTFKVDPIEVKEEWEYSFILQLEDCQKCKVINAKVIYFGLSPEQAGKNNREALRLYETSRLEL